MTDPLSIASGVAGLLSLGISVSQGIITYYSSWKDCPENVASTVQALNSLSNVLKNIRRTTEESSQLQLETREAIDNSVLSCRAVLEKLEKKLEKLKQPGNDPRRWGKVAGAIQRGIYPFKESTLSKLREHVSELRASLDLALSHANLELSSSTNVTVASLQRSEDGKRRQQLLAWISNDDSAEQQQSILEKREDGTGLWFTSSDEFTKWLTSTGSDKVLFCPGDPGTGKSFITCHAVDHLRSTTLSGGMGKPCVFYCNYKKRDQQTIRFATLSILRQLVAFLDQIPLTMRNHYDRCQRSKCHLTQSECVDLLKEMRALINGVQIVVDALDEFSTQENARNRFCGFLLDLADMLDAKLMVTTRNIEDISRHFEGKLRCEIKASNEDVDKFLKSYLRDKCDNPVIIEDPGLQSEIRSAIIAQIDGMFLLAKMQVESLVDRVSAKKVRQALTSLSAGPEGLQRAYEKAVEQVDSQRVGHRGLARQTIAWITLSRRPLSMKELQHAIAASGAKDDEPYEDLISPQNLVTSVCAGLVVHDVTTNSVRFVHMTTQEFFEGHLESWVVDAKAMIARACFTYASYAAEVHIQAFEALYAQGRESYEAFTNALYETFWNNNMLYPFLKYAATNAGTHAIDEPSGEWHGLALSILLKPAKSWIILKCFEDVENYQLKLREGLPSCNGSSIHGLNLAIRFNLPERVESLLEHGVPLFPVNSKESPPLNEAIKYERFDIVQKLVEAGAQDAARENASGRWEDPLCVAAEHDRAGRFVSLLLENDGMDVDITTGVRQTALGVAASSGNMNAVKLLLESRDVFADSTNSSGETPFMMAAKMGRADVVQLFLERADVDPYTVASMRRDAILLATRNGHSRVCKLLIERHIKDGMLRSRIENGPRLKGTGDCLNRTASLSPISKPDDENRDKLGFELLCLFGRRGDTVTMGILLNHGVDVALGQYTYPNPVLLKSYHPDHTEVIDFLLERGAGLDAKSRYGKAALHEAISDRHINLAEEMIARGADVNLACEDDEGMTPLMLAARFEQIKTTRLLLSKGAVVDKCDKNGLTALAHAVEYKVPDKDVVSLLLENGASIDGSAPSGPTRFSTPLIRATAYGRTCGVRLLLEHACKVDLCDSDGNTALAWAARTGKLDTISLLVEHSADVNTADKDGTTPLMYAIEENRYTPHRASISDVIQELLKCGAKIDAHSTTGLTALHMATRAPLDDNAGDHSWISLDDVAVLNTLVKHGMDVNMVDDTGRTPLMLAAQHGKKNRTQFLLAHGAQIDQRDSEGRDACAWAEANDNVEIAEMLQNAAAKA